MKAVFIREFGGPGVLEIAEVPTPEPGTGEVLIKVAACGVNRRDAWVRAGLRNRELPRVLGSDISGEIVSVGVGVDSDRVGMKVVVYPVTSCGRCLRCRLGDRHLCPQAGLLGADRDGGYAEFVAVEEWRAFPAPSTIPIELAAALPVVYTTAAQLVRRTRLNIGERILIWGASSALGRATIDLARLRSPAVLLATAHSSKIPMLAEVTADVLAYDTPDLLERIAEKTDGDGVHVVVDHVGAATWDLSLQALARGGRLGLAGATTGAQGSVQLLQFLARGLEIHGCFVGSTTDFAGILDLTELGLLVPTAELLPLDAAADVHERLEQGANLGKLILVPAL